MDGIFPASFWPLALAHGFALLSPGPDFMLIVSHGIRHRLRGSAFICLGIAAGNAAYIALAIAGWMGLTSPFSVLSKLRARSISAGSGCAFFVPPSRWPKQMRVRVRRCPRRRSS